MCRDLNALFRFLLPTERWNTICVSRDCLSLLHSDTANLPGSPNLSLSLGSFTGGRLWLEDLHCLHLGAPTSVPLGDAWLHGVAIDTCCRPLCFDGRIRHMTLPYQGERWALTAFTLPDVCCHDLEFLGFPLPSAEGYPSLPLSPSGSSPSLVGVEPLSFPAPVTPQLSYATTCPASAQAHATTSPALPLGTKLWGKHSFRLLCPAFHFGQYLPPPDSRRADSFAKSPAGRFFLEVSLVLRSPFARPSAKLAGICCASQWLLMPLSTCWSLSLPSDSVFGGALDPWLVAARELCPAIGHNPHRIHPRLPKFGPLLFGSLPSGPNTSEKNAPDLTSLRTFASCAASAPLLQDSSIFTHTDFLRTTWASSLLMTTYSGL